MIRRSVYSVIFLSRFASPSQRRMAPSLCAMSFTQSRIAAGAEMVETILVRIDWLLGGSLVQGTRPAIPHCVRIDWIA